MRKYICNIMIALLLLAFLQPLRVLAASGDGLRLDQGGTVTVVSQHAAKEGVSSLCFILSVESANAARVEFQFEDSSAKIKDFRYDEATGSLKIYLAGTEALFTEGTDTLTVGKIKALDGSGNEVTATVSAVDNSLQYVYGTEVKTMQGVELPEAVQIGPAVVQPTPEPQPPTEPLSTPEPQPPAEPQPTPEPQAPTVPQLPVTTQPPAVIPTAAPQLPAILPTPRPVQPPRATESPGPTAGPRPTASPRPTENPESRPLESENQSEESRSEDVPQLEEDILLLPSSPSGEDGDQTGDGDSGGANLFVVIAVAAVLVVVVIEVMAFVVLKKPRDSKRRKRRGSED